MTILMLACSKKAYELMLVLKERWLQKQPSVTVITKVKCTALSEISEKKSLSEIVGEWFERVDAIVFFCAAGIAVRSIAPYLRHKSLDPGIIVVDETGKFCISLLSGHAGGANEMTQFVAELLGALPVITTATDREEKFAVDDFARQNHLILTDWKLAKEISVKILAGEKIGFLSEIPVEGEVPAEIDLIQPVKEKAEKTGIFISWRIVEKPPFLKTLQLVPRQLFVGIGCKKGTAREKIEAAIEACFRKEKLSRQAIAAVASIDLKKEERGLLAYCERRNLPFYTYSAKELSALTGEFTKSAFVEQTTGVGSVCERSAVLAAGGSNEKEHLLVKKQIYEGVTIAIAKKKGRIVF